MEKRCYKVKELQEILGFLFILANTAFFDRGGQKRIELTTR